MAALFIGKITETGILQNEIKYVPKLVVALQELVVPVVP